MRVAALGNLSGPAGSIFKPIMIGYQVWIQHVNGGRGLKGHPVEVFVYDDGGDPARRRAQLREAVEQRGAIAIFDSSPVAGPTTVSYIEEKRIPVVGTDTGGLYPHDSPMYFPQSTSGDPLFRTLIYGAAQQLLPRGQKELATIVCVEVDQCGQIGEAWADVVESAGFELVYKAKSSITQPDFTAECLTAQRAGAKVLALAMDSNSIRRFATSCSRQAFRPVFLAVSGLIHDSFKDDPNLGAFVGVSNFYPYFLVGNAAVDEYRRAVAAFAKDAVGIGSMTGWTAGKLLEKVTADLPEPPSSDAILKALWRLKGETLGGLSAAPLTFHEGEKPRKMECWYNIAIEDGRWVSPNGAQRHCH